MESMGTSEEKYNQKCKATVLLVEDNFYTRDILHIALKQNGYRVIEAEDGAIAEKILTDTVYGENINCIILDRLMPNLNGYDFLARIKQNPSIREIPVIILSDLESDEDIEQSRRLGAAAYLVKVRNIPYGVVEKVNQLMLESRASDRTHDTPSPPPTL